MDGGEMQHGFVGLLVEVIDGLIARSSHNRKSLLGPTLARDLSAWENGSVRVSDAKFGEVMRELGRHVARADCRRLHTAFATYRFARDQAYRVRRNGRVAASMKPFRAEALIEQRLAVLGFLRAGLADPETFQTFVDAAVLDASRRGDYGAGSAAAQALVVLLDRPHGFFGSIAPSLRLGLQADAAFHLGLNGYYSRQAAALRYALDILARTGDAEADRAILAYRHHVANLLARLECGAEQVGLAQEALASPAVGPVPLRANVARAIRARYLTQHYVLGGAPLDAKTDSGLTVAEELALNRDAALAIGAMDSHVVAHVALVETMLLHGEVDAAQRHLGGAAAAMTLPGARTANTVQLFGDASALLGAALEKRSAGLKDK